MNSWQIIREYFCQNTKPDTAGEVIALRKAAKLFMKVKDNLIDRIIAVDCFNVDKELSIALFSQAIVEVHESLTGEKI